jgi:hypothetical protein
MKDSRPRFVAQDSHGHMLSKKFASPGLKHTGLQLLGWLTASAACSFTTAIFPLWHYSPYLSLVLLCIEVS